MRADLGFSTRFGIAASLLVLALSVAPVRAAAGDYLLGAGDLLRISVSGYQELGLEVRVSQSGNISFPYLGQLSVAGLSTGEVETLIARRLVEGQFVRQPQVSVLIVDYQSQKASVMGQVNKPGQYSLEISRRLIDLLAQAGGLDNATAADQATVLRADGSKVQIDLLALFNGDSKQNFTVSSGDTIYVPRAPQFYVYGEVQRPGKYRLERNMTVSQAISAGGGLTARGSERRAVVKRRDDNGLEHVVSIGSGDLVQADDVLMIKESIF